MLYNCRKPLMITRKTRKYTPNFVRMKISPLIRINLLIFMILCSAGTVKAQYNYKTALGLRLNGGAGISAGILKVISTYGGTETGNRARYIAGACYLQNGDFNNAIKYLKDFSTSATQVQTAAYMMLGDAHAELKKNDDALSYFKKAAAVNTKDEFMTPEALYKAAQLAENSNKTADAVELFKKIRDEYPKSTRAADVDKYLARLGVLN